MQAVADFFAFRTFVSLDVLRVVYALGAIGMPLLAWGVWLWLARFPLRNWLRYRRECRAACGFAALASDRHPVVRPVFFVHGTHVAHDV